MKDVNLKDVLEVNDAVTKREAFTDTGLGSVALEFTDEAVTGTFELFQNRPNPFNSVTTIGFNLPEASETTLTIYTIDGRVVKQITQQFEAGRNEIRLESTDLNATGVLYYQLDTEKYSATKKMVLQQ
jgi:hypothetical protein